MSCEFIISGLCIELKSPQRKERALGLEDWGTWKPPAHGWVRRTFPKAEEGPQVPGMMGTHTSLPHSAPGRWHTSEESGCGEEAHRAQAPGTRTLSLGKAPVLTPCLEAIRKSSFRSVSVRTRRLLNDYSALWKSSRAFTSWRESL